MDPKWGVVGLTASASVAAWIEFVLLLRSLNRRIGRTGLPLGYIAKLWFGAVVGAGVGWLVKTLVGPMHPIPLAILVLNCFGLTYFAVTAAFGVSEVRVLLGRVFRVLGLRKR